MSTEPSRLLFVLAVCAALAACAPAGGPTGGSFSRIGSSPPPRRMPQGGAPHALTVDASPATAQARVSAFLQAAGFVLEPQAAENGSLRLEATRMGPPDSLDGEASCPLQALRRPTLATSELAVRLSPAPGHATRVSTQARFTEVKTELLSGDLARATCRSSGALETAVVEAAARGG